MFHAYWYAFVDIRLGDDNNEWVEEYSLINFNCFTIELEIQASKEDKTERRIAPGEARFVWNLIQKHGNNYKVTNFLSYLHINGITW